MGQSRVRPVSDPCLTPCRFRGGHYDLPEQHGLERSPRPAYIEVVMKHLFPIPIVVTLLGAGPAIGQDHVHPSPGEKLGTVHFETSCAAAAQPAFDRAVSLLHSFEFGAAISSFGAALEADPTCGMTQWGVALSRWGNPFTVGARSAAQIKNGFAAVERARAIGATTERERAYIDA